MIPELLLLYFAEMSEKELLVLALVCRAWSLVALDLFWSTNYVSISMLAGRLFYSRQIPARRSRRIFKDLRLGKSSQDPRASWDIHPDDWSYFLDIAQKITRLRLPMIPDRGFTDKLLEEIESRGNMIFPQLTSLYIDLDSFFGTEWSPILSLVLTPIIETLDIVGTIDDMDLVNTVVLQATSIAKRIHNFGVSGPFLPPLLQPPSDKFQQLTILRLHRFVPEVLHEISHLPNLVELYFESYQLSAENRLLLADDITLPALEILSFNGDVTTPYLRIHILIDVVMPRLRTLILRPYLEWEYDDPDGIRLLEERSPLLERVDVGLGPGPGPNVWSLASLTTCLAQLTQLREIKIETHRSSIVLCDRHITWFVEHLPLLESLVLDPRDAEDPMAFPWKALMGFTAFPTVLKHLDIPLNLSTIGEVYPSPLPPPGHKTTSTLRSFRAQPLTLSGKHVKHAARFLGRWCPNVKDLDLQLKFVNVVKPSRAKRFEEAFWTELASYSNGIALIRVLQRRELAEVGIPFNSNWSAPQKHRPL
ncbi:hypothetical protein FRB94_010510 [Tulasnella sp. JGI-2019a]|nr:hypothetical protein FRB93_003514 [Tulasnella sp. JGI-2019a]KAG8993627.1 hypothetical protein FRB94_010510 [Tulasnella sp. JGI-2019a]KAG9027777.1 hypothetical protein FRB95_007384 [Tulasnella sp. JGI-2019a]